MQQFHIAGIRGVTVKHLGRPTDAAHNFGQRRVLKIGQRCAGFPLNAEPVRKRFQSPCWRARLFRSSINVGGKVPAVTSRFQSGDARNDMRIHEILDLGPKTLNFYRVGEIHTISFCV